MGFNGAAALRPRKLICNDASRGTGTACFNGAAALRPRKPITLSASSSPSIELQWGRGFEAAETMCLV